MKKTAILKKLQKACDKAIKAIRKDEDFPGELNEEANKVQTSVSECVRFIERDEISRASEVLRKLRGELFDDDFDDNTADIFDALSRSMVE